MKAMHDASDMPAVAESTRTRKCIHHMREWPAFIFLRYMCATHKASPGPAEWLLIFPVGHARSCARKTRLVNRGPIDITVTTLLFSRDLSRAATILHAYVYVCICSGWKERWICIIYQRVEYYTGRRRISIERKVANRLSSRFSLSLHFLASGISDLRATLSDSGFYRCAGKRACY